MIDFLSDNPSILTELPVGVLLSLVLIYVVRLLPRLSNDELNSELVAMAAAAQSHANRMREAYEKNTAALTEVGKTLVSIRAGFEGLSVGMNTGFDALQESIALVKDSLFKSSSTRFKIRGANGDEIVTFRAAPELDEVGNTVLVITFEEMK